MMFDKLFELTTPPLKRCPYAKNCGDEEIRACYENYEKCTIYQRNRIVNQIIGSIDIKPISRIEKIVE